jgi:hypothetical protein
MTKGPVIARARQKLAAIVRGLEQRARIRLTRRAKPAAAVSSSRVFKPAMASRGRFWDAYEKFRKTTDLPRLDIDPAIFEDASDRAYE